MSARAIRILAAVVLALTGAWLFLCLGTSCSEAQRGALVWGGEHPMLDWAFLRLPADFADCYARADLPEVFPGAGPIPPADVCNPPLAYALARLLPATFRSGLVATAFGAALYLAAAAFFLKRRGAPCVLPAAIALGAAYPFLFAVQVGNDVLCAAAAALVFLALYDAESRRARMAAAACLALAFAIKISPALLGVLYFGRGFRRRLPQAALAAGLGTVLLLVPFAWYGGMSGFRNWFACAAANSAAYEFRNVIGIYGIFFEGSRIVGRAGTWHAAAGGIVHAASCLLAAVALAMAAFDVRKRRPSRLFLAVAGMLMLPPTMMVYTLLYALPVLFLLPGPLPALAFAALANPLQIFVGGGSLQPFFAAVSYSSCFFAFLLTGQQWCEK